ncbi:hypothetical protein M8494_36210 [Serratia ureilytica]
MLQKNFWGTTAGVSSGWRVSATRHHQRVAQLGRHRALAPQDGMNSMADVVQTHAKQLKSLAERRTRSRDRLGR